MKRFSVLLIIAAAVLAACAVREPPSGGPEDKSPPVLLNTVPAADSSGLPRDIDIRIVFNEKIDGESFKDRIIFYPPVTFDDIETSGSELYLTFEGMLPETTLSLYLRKGYRDYHGVESEKGRVFYYCTADSFEKGAISGRATFKGEVNGKAVVKLSSLEQDTLELFRRDELRTVPVDRNGDFIFRHLPVDSTGMILWAFIDENDDGNYSKSREFFHLYPDTLFLASSRSSITGTVLDIIDPDEPGQLQGTIVNETVYDTNPSILITALDDEQKEYYSLTDSTGNYLMRGISPGLYAVQAFLDINSDSTMGLSTDPADSAITISEPGIVLPDSINLKPGENKSLDDIIIKKESSGD